MKTFKNGRKPQKSHFLLHNVLTSTNQDSACIYTYSMVYYYIVLHNRFNRKFNVYYILLYCIQLHNFRVNRSFVKNGL